MPEPILESFGECFKYLRARTGLTQEELGTHLGYSGVQIGRFENNQRTPSRVTVEARFTGRFTQLIHPFLETDAIVLAKLAEFAAAHEKKKLEEHISISHVKQKTTTIRIDEETRTSQTKPDTGRDPAEQAVTPDSAEGHSAQDLTEQSASTSTSALPSRGLVGMAVGIGALAYRRLPRSMRYHHHPWQRAGLIAGLLLTVVSSWYYWSHSRPISAEAYIERGKACYFNQNDYNCAIANATEALRLKPTWGEAYYLRGASFYRLGDFARAIDDQTQALKDPTLSVRGWAYYVRGTPTERKGRKNKRLLT
jgi:transcriptional regulator with XRE-family HTH domain